MNGTKKNSTLANFWSSPVLLVISLFFFIQCVKQSDQENILGAFNDQIPSPDNSKPYVPAIEFTPANYDFGNVSISSTVTKSILLSNSESSEMELGTLSLVGSSAFSQTNDCGSSLAVGSSCTINVAFTPVLTSMVSTTLTANYGSGFKKTINIIGNGTLPPPVIPSIELNPSSYDFGNVSIASTVTKSILVSNAGSEPVTLGSITLSGNSAFSQTNDCGSTLNAGASCTIIASFTPSSSSITSTMLIVNFGTGSQKAMSIIGAAASSLMFTGLDSVDQIGASSARLNWTGAVPTGGATVSAYLVYQISNTGVRTLVATLANSVRTHTLTGLTANTQYSYRVEALDSFGVETNFPSATRTFLTQLVAFDPIATISVQEQSSVTRTLSCSNIAGDTPVYSLISQSDVSGNCSLVGATLTCTPSIKSSHGTWTSTLTLGCVIDGLTLNQNVTLSVSDLNRAPGLVVPTSRTFPNPIYQAQNAIFVPSASDPDGDTLTYSCTVGSVGLGTGDANYVPSGTLCSNVVGFQGERVSIDESTGVVSWNPSLLTKGTYRFSLTVSDNYGGSTTGFFDATVSQFFASGSLQVLNPNYVENKVQPGTVNQATTWSDISASVNNVSLLNFEGNFWRGSGNYTDPYRLVFDGVDSHFKYSTPTGFFNNAFTNIYYYILFRIPSTAGDGIHPILNYNNHWLFAYQKGGDTPNRLITINYANGAAPTSATATNSFKLDEWHYLNLRIFHGGSGSNLEVSGFLPNVSLGSAGTNSGTFVGYKPVGVGASYDPSIDSTVAKGSEIEVKNVWLYNNNNDTVLVAQNYLAAIEELRRFPLGEIRRNNMRFHLDAANSDYTLYKNRDPGTQCISEWFPIGGPLTQMGRSNGHGFLFYNFDASCTGTTGFQGSGSSGNPFRVSFDGVDDHLLKRHCCTGDTNTNAFQDRPFSSTTRENSLEFWVKPSTTGNTGSATYGGTLLHFLNHNGGSWGRLMNVAVSIKNNLNGTSSPVLYFNSTGQVAAIAATTMPGVIVNGEWNHIVFTFSDSGQMKGYRNGALFYTSADGALSYNPFAGEPDQTNNNFWRGMWQLYVGWGHSSYFPGAAYYKGDVSIVRSYAGYALTDAEVLFHCNTEAARFQGVVCAATP